MVTREHVDFECPLCDNAERFDYGTWANFRNVPTCRPCGRKMRRVK